MNSGVFMKRQSYVSDLLFSLRSTCHRSPGVCSGDSDKYVRLLVFIDFRQSVISQQVSFSVGVSFFAWAERSHTGHAYSAAE